MNMIILFPAVVSLSCWESHYYPLAMRLGGPQYLDMVVQTKNLARNGGGMKLQSLAHLIIIKLGYLDSQA
jgi:hypothetical protein